MKIRGATPEARTAARRVRTAQNRANWYAARVRAAGREPQRQVEIICYWLAAIANDLPPVEAAQLAEAARGLAAEWNRKTA